MPAIVMGLPLGHAGGQGKMGWVRSSAWI
jgi:hypothetical protein